MPSARGAGAAAACGLAGRSTRVRVVIGFSLPAREAASEHYAELTAADYAERQPPSGAFRGARYAIVAGPGGNDVGLMSPVGESRRPGRPGSPRLPDNSR